MSGLRPFARVVALSLLIAPTAQAAPRHARHAAIDWTRTGTVTPEGGIRVGNPDARVRLVEYGSFTCPHCAAFATEAYPAIRDRYVRTGKLSFEFRPALRDGADMLAAQTVWCAGPAGFINDAVAVFGAQNAWLPAIGTWVEQHPDDFKSADQGAAVPGLAQGVGLTAIAAKMGVPKPRYDQCLLDKALKESLAKAAGDAWNVRQIGATPTFYLNDDKLDGVYGWAALEPQIRARVGG